MCVSIYLELLHFTSNFITIEIPQKIKEKFEKGIKFVIPVLIEYFNKGSLTSFMVMMLDPHLKSTVYIEELWEADFEFMFDKYNQYYTNRMNEYFADNYCHDKKIQKANEVKRKETEQNDIGKNYVRYWLWFAIIRCVCFQ